MKSDNPDPLDGELTGQESAQASATLADGATLGQYRIIRLLGRGGMGEVYEAEHQVLHRRYALKLLPPDFACQPGALERFQREAQVMANLEHPHIIRVDDFGETGGRYWLRMELAGGVQRPAVSGQPSAGEKQRLVSLQDLAEARGGKISQAELLPILKQILDGLEYAHRHGAIHRDLKPANILLFPATRAETPVAKIADFGLVRLIGEEWVRSQAQISVQRSVSLGDQPTMPQREEGTSTRSLLGTYEYMSPEQKRGETADERSDLYAVGLLTYRLLTGRALGMKTPSQIDRELAPGWDALLAGMLEEDRAERKRNCQEVNRELEAVERQIADRQRQKTEAEAQRLAEQDRLQREAERQRLEVEKQRQLAEERRRQQEERALKEQAEASRLEAEKQRLAQAERLQQQAAQEQAEQSRRRLAKGFIFAIVTLGVCLGGYFIFKSLFGESSNPAPKVVSIMTPAPVVNITPTTPPATPSVAVETPTHYPDLKSPWENSLGMKFVPVPGTEVLFGIWLTRVQDFKAFVQATGHDATTDMYSLRADGWKQRGDTWEHPGFEQGPTYPVCGVSWEDAQAFCKWLTGKERGTGLIAQNQEYRLPKDWEWSVAVGLNETKEGTPQDKNGKIKDVYPWGNEWPPPRGAGNFAGEEVKNSDWPSAFPVIAGYNDGFARTAPVGSFQANQYGLFDMSGNLWEWCEDFYNGQSGTPVLRGGSWYDHDPDHLLSSYRFINLPGFRFGNLGFRVVLVSSPKA